MLDQIQFRAAAALGIVRGRISIARQPDAGVAVAEFREQLLIHRPGLDVIPDDGGAEIVEEVIGQHRVRHDEDFVTAMPAAIGLLQPIHHGAQKGVDAVGIEAGVAVVVNGEQDGHHGHGDDGHAPSHHAAALRASPHQDKGDDSYQNEGQGEEQARGNQGPCAHLTQLHPGEIQWLRAREQQLQMPDDGGVARFEIKRLDGFANAAPDFGVVQQKFQLIGAQIDADAEDLNEDAESDQQPRPHPQDGLDCGVAPETGAGSGIRAGRIGHPIPDEPGEDGRGQDDEKRDDRQHVAGAPGHAARPVVVAAVSQKMEEDEQQEGHPLPAEAPGEGNGADEAQQQYGNVPEQALVGADGEARQRSQHAHGHRLGKLGVGGVFDDVAGEEFDAAEGGVVVNSLHQQHQRQGNEGGQEGEKPLSGQAGTGVGRAFVFVGEGQDQQRGDEGHAGLFGDEGEAQAQARQRGPAKLALRRRPIAQQCVHRQQIGQHGQRFPEEGAAVRPGQGGEGVHQRSEHGGAPLEAQGQQDEIKQNHREGGDQNVEEHGSLHRPVQGPAPQIEGNAQQHLPRLVVGHHIPLAGEHAHVGVIPVDLIDGEFAPFDEAVDAAEQGPLIVALERAHIGEGVDGEDQEEEAHSQTPITLSGRLGMRALG